MDEFLEDNARFDEASVGGGFIVGDCPNCQRDVLTARSLDDGELIDVCLHCEHRFEPEALRSVSVRTVAQMGYDIDGYQDDDCDSHGGCRDGSCGVQQPEQ